jgi:hypothetical protein
MMKKCFGVVLFLTAACCGFAQNMEARLLELSGTVELKEASASGWRTAAADELIKKDTVISTGFKSTALIVMGNSRLTVRPLTRLSLEELIQRDGGEEIALYLRSGRVRADVTPPVGGKTDFTIRSPVATASVRGTSFEFDTRHLHVDNGTVRLAAVNGQSVYVAEGQNSYIDESEQRAVPPFEAENESLRLVLPDLASTNSGAVQAPEIAAGGVEEEPQVPDAPPVDIGIDWP